LSLKLKHNKKYYRYYKKHNLKTLSKGDKSRKILYKKRKGCCMGIAKLDAEDHYKQKINKRLLQIREREEEKRKINGGFGFVSFISNLQVKTCLNRQQFRKLLKKYLT
jgi:hypothetical protein